MTDNWSGGCHSAGRELWRVLAAAGSARKKSGTFRAQEEKLECISLEGSDLETKCRESTVSSN